MSNLKDANENPDAETPKVSKVFGSDKDTDSVGMPDQNFLGLSPGDANDETEPGADPVPHGG